MKLYLTLESDDGRKTEKVIVPFTDADIMLGVVEVDGIVQEMIDILEESKNPL